MYVYRLTVRDTYLTPIIVSSQYNQMLTKLVSASYLKPSTILSHISPRDKSIQYETEEKRKIVGFPTAKELREAKDVAQARLKREEEAAEEVGLVRRLVNIRNINLYVLSTVLLETESKRSSRS